MACDTIYIHVRGGVFPSGVMVQEEAGFLEYHIDVNLSQTYVQSYSRPRAAIM